MLPFQLSIAHAQLLGMFSRLLFETVSSSPWNEERQKGEANISTNLLGW